MLGLLFSKTRHHFKINFLFVLTGYFGLFKEVNISFFSSFLTQPSIQTNRATKNSWHDEECLDTHSDSRDFSTQTSKSNLPTPCKEDEDIIFG